MFLSNSKGFNLELGPTNRFFIAVGLAGLMSGCNMLPVKNEKKSPVAQAQVLTSARKPAPISYKDKMVYELLQLAQQALKQNQLTTPSHNNAYDFFQSALMLDKGNSQAKSGLQSILIRYAALVRKALSESDFDNAQTYLDTAKTVFGRNPLLSDLTRQLKSDRENARRMAESQDVKPVLGSGKKQTVYMLNKAALSTQSDMILKTLTRIAERIADSKESVLIYARTDREGRWVYQTLNKAAVGYRVRGDIRLAKTPKIVLLPPLN